MIKQTFAFLRTFVFATLVPAISISLVSCEPDDIEENKNTSNITSSVNNGAITGNKNEGSDDDIPYETPENIPEGAVDLGLSVFWAECNIGATKSNESGDYYAWGEITKKKTSNWTTYKWCDGSDNTLTKYCTDSQYGTVDNRITLDLEDDIAHVKLGGNWRMPTIDELNELREKCTWTWTENGYEVTSRRTCANDHTKKSIFLPAAGYYYEGGFMHSGSKGDYWSSTLSSENNGNACCLFFDKDGFGMFYDYRYYGHSIRPVADK